MPFVLPKIVSQGFAFPFLLLNTNSATTPPTESLVFPIVMLTLSIIGGFVAWIYIKKIAPRQRKKQTDASLKTAQEFINVKNIHDKCLYTNDGLVMVFLRLQSISVDLYSATEKNVLMRQLTSEISEINYPFKFIALSRPVDISNLITTLTADLQIADGARKELIEHEIREMKTFAQSKDIHERQFYVSIWDKVDFDREKDLMKRAYLLAEKFTQNGIPADVIVQDDIVRLINLVHNPSSVKPEDSLDIEPHIPMLKV